MYKTVFLLLSATLALANEDASGIPVQKPSSVENVSGTNIDLKRSQYDKVLEEYDAQIGRAINASTVPDEEIHTEIDVVGDMILEFNDHLDSFKPNSFKVKCRNQYQSLVPSLLNTQVSIQSCVTSNEVSALFNEPNVTRNSLQDYFENYFEPEIENCTINHNNATESYESCVEEAISKTDTLIISNRETFLQQMEMAESNAKTFHENALSCICATQLDLITSINETLPLIAKCVQHESDSYVSRRSCLGYNSKCLGKRTTVEQSEMRKKNIEFPQ